MKLCCQTPEVIENAGDVKSISHVAHLDRDDLDFEMLSEMVLHDRLVASPNGQHVAWWTIHTESEEPVVTQVPRGHRFRTMQSHFLSVNDEGEALFSGTRINGQVGLFRVSTNGIQQVAQRQKMVALMRQPNNTLVVLSDPQHPLALLRVYGGKIPDGFPVNIQSYVLPAKEGEMLVLEPVQNSWYRYQVGAQHQIRDFHPVSLSLHSSSIQAIGLWKECVLMVECVQGQSVVRLLGAGELDASKRVISVGGVIEQVWQSPNHEGIAWLSRHGTGKSIERRLTVNHHVLLRGEFTMGPSDLVWTPSGEYAAVCVNNGLSGTGERVICSPTNTIRIDPRTTLREFAVDDQGHVCAFILLYEGLCTPFVYGQEGDANELVWNLKCTSEGVVHYNTVEGDVILRVEYRRGTQESTD